MGHSGEQTTRLVCPWTAERAPGRLTAWLWWEYLYIAVGGGRFQPPGHRHWAGDPLWPAAGRPAGRCALRFPAIL